MINKSQFPIHYSLFFLILLTGLSLMIPSMTQAQQPPTSTPDAEGNIYVVVQANDSLWGIAVQAGLTLEELVALNGLTADSIITPGQFLLIAQGIPPETPTQEALPTTPTATRPPPPATATAVPPPRTAICLKAFSDLNRNGSHDAGEPFKSAVAFTVFTDQMVVGNYVTDGTSGPYCLEALEPGEYKITRSISQEETLTTEGDWTIMLALGNVVELAFGSYSAVTPSVANPVLIGETSANASSPRQSEESGNNRSAFIFIRAGLVVIFLLVGWFIFRLLNRKRQLFP